MYFLPFFFGLDQVDKFERQLGCFVYATTSPFSLVDNVEFKNLMELARPGIKLPARHAIGGRILQVVYDEEWGKFKQKVSRFGIRRPSKKISYFLHIFQQL